MGSMRSQSLLEQVAGRIFRADFPQIIHLVDDVQISENHWKDAQSWYISRNGYIMIYDSPYAVQKKKVDVSSPEEVNAQIQAQLNYLQNGS